MEYYFSPGECRCLVKRSVLVLCFGGAERILGVCVCVCCMILMLMSMMKPVFLLLFFTSIEHIWYMGLTTLLF